MVWRPRRRIGNRLAFHSRSAHAASHLSTWLAAMGCTQHRIINWHTGISLQPSKGFAWTCRNSSDTPGKGQTA
jgi:hypothetical protein